MTFIHVLIASSRNHSFIFAALWYSLNEYTTFINSAIYGHLVYFQFGAISNNAIVTTLVSFSLFPRPLPSIYRIYSVASGVHYQTESCPSPHGPSASTPVRSAWQGYICSYVCSGPQASTRAQLSQNTFSQTSLQSTRAHRVQATTPQLLQVRPQGPLTLATGHGSHARGAGSVRRPSRVALEGLGSTPDEQAVQSHQHLPTCGPGASMSLTQRSLPATRGPCRSCLVFSYICELLPAHTDLEPLGHRPWPGSST